MSQEAMTSELSSYQLWSDQFAVGSNDGEGFVKGVLRIVLECVRSSSPVLCSAERPAQLGLS